MRLQVIAILFFSLLISCKAKDSTPAGVEQDLKTAMQAYLYSAVNNDSSNVTYRVQDVTYFEDADKYICDFKVTVKAKLFDTTGVMRANVSKDFQKITRLQ